MAIFTFIGGAVAGAFAAAGTAAFTFIAGATAAVLQIAASFGLSYLAAAISGKPKTNAQGFSVQGKIQAGGDVPRSFILGERATAGSLVYKNEWGQVGETPNAYSTDVIALSDLPLPSDALTGIWVDGTQGTLLTGEAHADYGIPISEYRKGGVDHLWVKFKDGTQVTADAFLTGTVSSVARPYESTRVGVGVAYVIVTARINQELFNGFPQYKFVLKGVKLYDPSKDATIGGVGTHVYSNPATWGGDGDNFPIVQIYNLFRGFYYDGEWLYGLQNFPAARLPAANWIANVAKCRAVITGDSGPEPTFRTSVQINVNAEIISAVEALLMGCQGRVAEIGGIYKTACGAPDAPVYSFTDDDIITDKGRSFKPIIGIDATINGVNAKYPSPDEAWNMKVAPILLDADLETIDGGRRLMTDVSLDCVPYPEQVQRLMKAAVAEARRERRHTFELPPEAWELEPLDTVEWNSEENGYVDKLFRVNAIGDRTNLEVMIDLTEYDPDDYDWNTATDYQPPVYSPINANRPDAQAVKDWAAVPWTLIGDDARERPAIKLSWDGTLDDLKGILFEVRRVADGVVVHTGNVENVKAGAVIITQSLTRDTNYEVRGKYVPQFANRETLWSSWLAVKTPATAIIPTSGTITLPTLGADAASLYDQEMLNWRGINITINEALQRNVSDRRIIAQANGNRASFSEQITVMVSDTAAIATRTTTLEANVALNSARITNEEIARANADSAESIARLAVDALLQGNINTVDAAVITESSARATADTALANYIAEVTAGVTGTGVANSRFRATAVSAPSGVAARIEIQARVAPPGAGSGDQLVYKTAGIYIDVLETSPGSGVYTSRIVFAADHVAVEQSVGGTVQYPWLVSGGIVRMNLAHIGTVTAGTIQDAAGTSMVITPATPRILIYGP